MTSERLRECLDSLRWWTLELVDYLGANPRTVTRWISGKNEIPSRVGEWLERLMEYEESDPPPEEEAYDDEYEWLKKLVEYEAAMLAVHPPPKEPSYIRRGKPPGCV